MKFNTQNLANTAWSFDELWGGHPPLMAAISSAAIRIISDIDAQPLANLCDRGMPHHDYFESRLRSILIEFYNEVPRTLKVSDWDAYARAVDSIRIDNFGVVGTRILMDCLGVRDLPASFRERALAFVPRLGRLTCEVPRGEGVSWMRTRVVNYWEYTLEWPGGRLQAAEVGENALHGDVARDSRWLRAVTPPFNPFADRRTCSEFRSFDRLLEELARAGTSADESSRGRVSGCIMMLINAPPCVSCIGVMQ